VLEHAHGDSMRANRDYTMLALLFGCGLRRSKLVGLGLDEIQMRQGHWALVDLIGKGGHIRTVPIPQWVKAALDVDSGSQGDGGKDLSSSCRTGNCGGDEAHVKV
jgi:site-specific recombinase XerC